MREKKFFFKCIKQYDTTDCAAACIASIIAYYHGRITLPEVLGNISTTAEGSNILDIVTACEKLKLSAVAMKKEHNFKEEEIELPCMAHVMLKNGMFHYIVIYKITCKTVYISDPALGLLKVDRNDFFNSIFTSNSQYIWTGKLVFIKPTEQFYEQKKPIKKNGIVLRIITSNKTSIVKISFLSLVVIVLKIFDALFFQIILDIVVPKQRYYTLLLIAIVFVFLAIIRVFTNKVCVDHALRLSKSIYYNLSIEYYNHVLNLPISFHNIKKSGEIISRFKDISRIQTSIITGVLILPTEILMILTVGGMLLSKSIIIFLLIIFVCLAYFIMVSVFKNKYELLNSKQMREDSEITTNIVDALEGIETIKANVIEDICKMNIKQMIRTWQDSVYDLGKLENLQTALKTIIDHVGELLIITISAINVMQGKMTAGEMITYNLLVSYMLNPIKNIIDLQPKIQSAMVAVGRLESIFHVKEEEIGHICLKDALNFEFKDVSFKYNGLSNVVENISLYGGQFNKVAIVGKSGSGKTTIAKLLLKFYEAEGVFVNGYKISYINSKDLRKKIVYVSQEDFIFSDSILNNLTLWDDKISTQKVEEVTKLVDIFEFINSTKQQFNTVLEERGINLSKGQKQKIALGRALLRNPQILILDEATSNIDAESEKHIYNAISRITGLKTIIITHRLNNVIDSEYIYVLEKGKLVAEGRHEELISSLYYSKLFGEREEKCL